MADIGTRNETLMKQAIQDSEFAKDDRYDDNPYAIGNSLQNVNPENGQTYPETLSWDGINIPNEIQLASTSTHLISASTVTTTNAPVNSFVAQSGPSRSQRGGGRGHNHKHLLTWHKLQLIKVINKALILTRIILELLTTQIIDQTSKIVIQRLS